MTSEYPREDYIKAGVFEGDLISREALKNVILNDRKLDGVNANWEVNRILVHIDNAPTVEPEKAKESELIKAYTKGFDTGVETVKNERPQGECDKCDYYSFSKAFINGIVEVMSKYGITTVDELLELLRGGAE